MELARDSTGGTGEGLQDLRDVQALEQRTRVEGRDCLRHVSIAHKCADCWRRVRPCLRLYVCACSAVEGFGCSRKVVALVVAMRLVVPAAQKVARRKVSESSGGR